MRVSPSNDTSKRILMVDKKKQGKNNRKNGAIFERKVREELTKNGWIVLKNPNNVDLIKNKFVSAKAKFNPFTKRIMMNSGGFPDFIAYRTMELTPVDEMHFEIIGVECKTNGYLTPEEKEKIKWLIENKIMSRILIASKDEKNINYKVSSMQ